MKPCLMGGYLGVFLGPGKTTLDGVLVGMGKRQLMRSLVQQPIWVCWLAEEMV